MTRINCIPPRLLIDKHLLAEYHELPRVFSYVRSCVQSGKSVYDIHSPDTYVLGTGHVKFHAVRLRYLVNRYKLLIEECNSRGWKTRPIPIVELVKGIPNEWFGDWTPDLSSMRLCSRRIAHRIRGIKEKGKQYG